MIITASDEGWYIEGKPLIKCKNCKYWHDDMAWDDDMTWDDVENEETGYYCEYHETVYWRADDFCSKGEKR